MIVFVQRFSFKDEVGAQEREQVIDAIRRTISVEASVFSSIGPDLGDPSEGFTHAFVTALPDLDAVERYMHNPVHIAGDDFILPRLARQSAVRFSDDADPALGERIYEIYRRRVDADPAWGRRVDELYAAGAATVRAAQN
ncbi:Dabb family protein [Nocardia sp. NPDC003693]